LLANSLLLFSMMKMMIKKMMKTYLFL